MTEERPIPGPKGQFVIGSARQFQSDKLGFLKRCAEEFGDVFQFSVGPMRVVVVNDLEIINEILVERASHYAKSSVTRDIFGRIMGAGLMVSEGELHQRRRESVQRGFDGQRLTEYAKVARRHGALVSARWRAGEVIDVEAEMAKITIGMTAEVLFGADVGPEVERLTAALVTLQTAGSKLMNAGFVPPRWLPTPMNRELATASRVVNHVLDQVVTERGRSFEDRGDLLSSLLSPSSDGSSRLPTAALRDELRTLFLAGVETTANALTWTWYHLSRSPEARHRLEAALDRSSPGARIEPYTMMVVKESLRRSNPIWAFNRSPLEPETVEGYRLAPKDIVIISPFLLHGDPRYYRDPEQFDPERFSELREREIPRLAFLPFGAGPRGCIGARLALLELASVVSAIAKRFRLELSVEQTVEPEAFVSIRPRGGLRMRVGVRH